MVFDAETTARRALADNTNKPGYCQQWCREKAGIGSLYGTAAIAWKNTNDRYPGNRDVPRGAMAFWTGGSHGYGHIAVGLGHGMVRSTDSGGAGRPANVPLAWVEQHWGLPYAGWAWDVNEVTIPHEEPSEMNAADWDKMQKMINDAVKQVWSSQMEVSKSDGSTKKLSHDQVLRETYQKVAKAV